MACLFPGCDLIPRWGAHCRGHRSQLERGAPLSVLRPRGPRAIVPHPTDPSLALVELTKGYFATISAVDGPEVGRFNWHAFKKPNTFYARCSNREGEMLHRFIGRRMGLTLEIDVDHENGNGLDCRRSNLRDANESENLWNSRLRKDSSTWVKGVHRYKDKFTASLRIGGEFVYLGVFEDVDSAAAVVSEARTRLHGKFANDGKSN